MADEKTWAELLAARVTEPSRTEEAPVQADRGRPAWARVMSDRAMGREPDPEALAEAQQAGQRPRAEYDRRILDRLGYDQDEEPPPAA